MQAIFNSVLPMWLAVVIVPSLWIIIIPVSFIINSLVLVYGLKHLKYPKPKNIYKKTILKIVGYGFVADFVGLLILFLCQFINIDWWLDNIVYGINFNPFDNGYALMIIVMVLILIAYLIYQFNYHLVLKTTDLTWYQRHHLSFYLAIYTCPYILLIPTLWLFKL